MPTALATCAVQRREIAMTRSGEALAVIARMLRTLGLASLVLAGCIDDRDVTLPDDPIQVKSEWFEVPQVSPRPLDVLFVVDNSTGMAEHQERVLENLPVLGSFVDRNGWDMHVGIVSADVGCPGHSDWRYDEQLSNGQFLIQWRHADNTLTRNFDGELADHITRLASVGHEGCGEFRPLDAIAAAIDRTQSLFHRDEADVVIFVIGASDDQSIHSVEDLVALLAVDPMTRRPASVFAFVPEIAPRIRALAEISTQNHGSSAITDPDFTHGLGWIGSGSGWWGAHCFDSSGIDLDPAVEGIQPNCAISDVIRERDTNRLLYERVLPACNGANRPCWTAKHDPQNCSWTSSYRLDIQRTDFPPLDTITVGQCEVAENP